MNENVLTQSASANRALQFTGMLAFTLLTIVGAHIRIPLPFTPVPMTLQTFFVPLAGGFLGMAYGSASMLLYLALGILGFNVFASASPGLALFASPTAGYLIGYIFAAALVGVFRNRSRTMLFLALLASHIIIFAFGLAGLMLNVHMSLPLAFAKGIVPFVIGDALKLIASFLILVSLRPPQNAVQ